MRHDVLVMPAGAEQHFGMRVEAPFCRRGPMGRDDCMWSLGVTWFAMARSKAAACPGGLGERVGGPCEQILADRQRSVIYGVGLIWHTATGTGTRVWLTLVMAKWPGWCDTILKYLRCTGAIPSHRDCLRAESYVG